MISFKIVAQAVSRPERRAQRIQETVQATSELEAARMVSVELEDAGYYILNIIELPNRSVPGNCAVTSRNDDIVRGRTAPHSNDASRSAARKQDTERNRVGTENIGPERWRDHTGGIVTVVFRGTNETTGEPMVVFMKPNDKVGILTDSAWQESVHGEYLGRATRIPRFTRVR
jgi:hypothetical protein